MSQKIRDKICKLSTSQFRVLSEIRYGNVEAWSRDRTLNSLERHGLIEGEDAEIPFPPLGKMKTTRWRLAKGVREAFDAQIAEDVGQS